MLGSLPVILTLLVSWICFCLLTLVFVSVTFPFIMFYLSFRWLSFKLKERCSFSSHNFWLFSDGLRDHLKIISWENIFNCVVMMLLDAPAVVTKFFWVSSKFPSMYVRSSLNHLCGFRTATWATTIANRNSFSCLHHENKLSVSVTKLGLASYCCKRSYIKRQTNGTSSYNEWQRVTTSDSTSDNER